MASYKKSIMDESISFRFVQHLNLFPSIDMLVICGYGGSFLEERLKSPF